MIKTIALRFGEHFSPECGTIKAHQEVIDEIGHVWYGKLGNAISSEVSSNLVKLTPPRFLLISSGKQERYWVHFTEIRRDTPPLHEIPSYYRDIADTIKCWFKVEYFEPAPRNVMSLCVVSSSKSLLSEASRKSASPYFKIEYDDSNEGKNE